MTREMTKEEIRKILDSVIEDSKDKVTDGDTEPAPEEPTDGEPPE